MAPFLRDHSVASSSTVMPASVAAVSSAQATVGTEDICMTGTDLPAGNHRKHLIIAIDYGTTFSSVAFTLLERKGQEPSLSQIKTIKKYPGDKTPTPINEVPSELWYSDPAAPVDDPWNDIDFSSNGLSSNDDEDDQSHADATHPSVTQPIKANIRWGYGVREGLRFPDSPAHTGQRNVPITRGKLLLDGTANTRDLRKHLRQTLKELKKHKIIKNDEQVIADFLTCLLKFTKEQLEQQFYLIDNPTIELVLCVPAIWTPRACRKMHQATAIAVERTGLGQTRKNCIENLFIVSEPEAAAAFVLHGNYEIQIDETFVLIDAGGGTVDAITYTVDSTLPLRLKRETVPSNGKLCGSSYLNENFRKFALEKLRDQHYLEESVPRKTIRGIVESAIMIDFEDNVKRNMDFRRRDTSRYCFYVPGLKPSTEKGFREEKFFVLSDEFARVFDPILDQVCSLMEEQIQLCADRGLQVDKAILIGGFADCPALETKMREKLTELSLIRGSNMQLIIASARGTSAIAVASGAVLRASNKEDGPDRIIRSSYGILRNEPYEKGFEPHKKGTRTFDRLDGVSYVKDTIDWVIKLGKSVPPRWTERFTTTHTFDVDETTTFICAEEIYVSEKAKESHYQLNYHKNKGAERVGTFTVDMTFLKTESRLQPVIPNPYENKGQPHYSVTFDIVIEVDGLNLYYEARWPSGEQGQALEGSQGQLSIASSFDPGTE